MARKTSKLNEIPTRLYKTRDGRYGAIVGVHTRQRYTPDIDGHILVDNAEDLNGFLATQAWAVYDEDVLTIVNSEGVSDDDTTDTETDN